MIKKLIGYHIPCIFLFTVASCDSGRPTGQVLAKVNGVEITRRDLEAELGNANVSGPDAKKIQPLVLDRIVNRKLLVGEAEKAGISKSPDFLASEQRAHDMLLIEMLEKRNAAALNPPSPSAIRTFIAANPQMFNDRRIFKIDQIRVSAQQLDTNALRPFSTMEEIKNYLTTQGTVFQQASTSLDSATLPHDVYTKIMALPAGMPFVVAQGGFVLINVIASAEGAPILAQQQTAVARSAIQQLAVSNGIGDRLKALRKSAKITYQLGFSPPVASTVPPKTAG